MISPLGKITAIAKDPKSIEKRIKEEAIRTALGKFLFGFSISLTCTPESSIPKKEAITEINETHVELVSNEGRISEDEKLIWIG